MVLAAGVYWLGRRYFLGRFDRQRRHWQILAHIGMALFSWGIGLLPAVLFFGDFYAIGAAGSSPIFLGLHILAIRYLITALPKGLPGRLRKFLIAFMVALSLSAISVFWGLLSSRTANPATPLVWGMGRLFGVWFTATTLWLALMGLALLLGKILLRLAQKPAQKIDLTRRRFLYQTTSGVSAGATTVLFGTGIRSTLQTTRVELELPTLPAPFSGLKVAILSDLHYGPFVRPGLIKEAIDGIAALNPDIVLLGGDFIDQHETDIKACISLMRPLARLDAYAVLGNHDEMVNAEKMATGLEEAGITVLRTTSRTIHREGKSLLIGGHDYQTTHAPVEKIRSLLSKTFANSNSGTAKGDFRLLLAHDPKVFDAGAKEGIDLTVSGHYHGGQVNLLPINSGRPYKIDRDASWYRYGLYGKGGSLLFVTAGIGVSGLPLRLFSSPEIVLLTLHHGKSAAPKAYRSKVPRRIS